jgi:2'-5' RNA ligase
MANSLILTVLIDEKAQIYFDNLREEHFPAERNYLKAHLSLFHNLPQEDLIYKTLEEIGEHRGAFDLQVKGIVSIGNGVAFKIESRQLQEIHASLQKHFDWCLIPQDRQKLWPHITIQNKVCVEQVKLLKAFLEQDFKPMTIQARGFVLWEYLNGPWALHKVFNFGIKKPAPGSRF